MFPAFARLGAWRTPPIPYVPQLSATECGAACLAMTLAAFGRDVGLDGVRAASDAGRDGLTAGELLNLARRFGLEGRGVRLEMDELRYLERGAILHWISGHFVVFERTDPRGRIVIVDPAQGRCSLSLADFSRHFSGVALLLEPGTHFRKESRERPLLRRAAWLTRETKSLARLAVLSMMLQALGLALPIVTGTLLDRTIPSADVDMLVLLGVGGALAVLMFFIASLLRGALLVTLRTRLDASITTEFLGRLTRAPLTFLLQRGTGDLLQRMSSIASVRDLAAEGLISTGLDGFLVVTYLAVLVATSPQTALAVIALGSLELLLFLTTRGTQRRLLGEALATESRTSGFQVEFLAGLTTLKAMGLESLAMTRWTNLFVDNLNVSMKRGVLDSALDALRGALRMLGPLILLIVGAREVMSGRTTIGGMIAANTLAIGFLGPLAGLFSAASRFDRILGHLDRIDDVLSAPREQEQDPATPLPSAGNASGAISLEKVSFKYPGRASFGVGDITLQVGAGSRVALVGPSGAGKSTIANLILGLFAPSEGRVLHDHRELQSLDLESVRRKIGVVPQVPFFFTGTIRENITLGDPDVPMEAVVEAARRAQIHDEISAMPMGYQTLLLDRGGSLSGGQRQRLALARALCRRPSVLLLDEATSALDSLTEQRLRESISALECTRIVVAHRFATIIDFDLIAFVDQGRIVERGTHRELLALGGRYAKMFEAQNLQRTTLN